jgi:hypothetical protein
MFRIRMNLENPNSQLSRNMSSSVVHVPMAKSAPKNVPLNAPMIDRVHKAKPGCGSCGKKVV